MTAGCQLNFGSIFCDFNDLENHNDFHFKSFLNRDNLSLISTFPKNDLANTVNDELIFNFKYYA